MMKLGTFHGAALLLAGTFAAAAAFAQTASTPRPGARPAPSRSAPAAATPPAHAPPAAPAAPAPTGGNLQLPSNPVFLGDTDTSVRKATAIVNGSVITATDVDQRLALVVLANQGRVQPDEMQRLRDQVLHNLVDETLQIQAAEAADIKVEQREVDAYFARFSQSQNKT